MTDFKGTVAFAFEHWVWKILAFIDDLIHTCLL